MPRFDFIRKFRAPPKAAIGDISLFHKNLVSLFLEIRQKTSAFKIGFNDVKIYLLSGYAGGYLLAVYAPILIDPHLEHHVQYGARNYPLWPLCILIYALLLIAEYVFLKKTDSVRSLYASIIIFVFFVGLTTPIFSGQEIPHGNLVFVGALTAFISAFSVFVWWMGEQIYLAQEALDTAGEATFDYVKQLSTFARQGAFAGVTLFGALFFAAFQMDLKFSDTITSDEKEKFLLHLNVAFQITFFTVYAVAGAARYLFMIHMKMLSQFQYVAARIDEIKSKILLPGLTTSDPKGTEEGEKDDEASDDQDNDRDADEAQLTA